MAIEKDCILWPVRFTASPALVVFVTSGAGGEVLTLPTTAGRNYFVSGDDQADASTDGGVGDLVKMFETMLNTHTLAAGGFSVSVSSTGVLTVSHSSTTFLFSFADGSTTLDSAVFGLDPVSVSYVSSLTGPDQTMGIWYSAKMRSTDSRDRQTVVGAVAETISGLSRVSRLSLPKKTREIGWQLIPQAKVLDEYAVSTEPTGAFESAWVDAISRGYAFRIYDNASTRTGSSYGLYRTRNLNEAVRRSAAPTRFDVTLSCARADS